MKKLILHLGIVIAVLICVLAGVLIFSRGERIGSGDETSMYPYSYSLGKKTMTVKITGKFPKDSAWSAETESASATVETGKQTHKRAEFTLTAKEPGMGSVTFVLSGTGEVADRKYELSCRYLITKDLSFVIEDSAHAERTGTVGEDAETFSYRISALNDQTYYIRVTHDPAQNWLCRKAAGTVELDSLGDEGSSMTLAADGTYSEASVTGTRAGASTVYLENDQGDCVELLFSTGSTGTTSLLSYRILGSTDVRVTEDTTYTDTYGEIAAPVGTLYETEGRVDRWLSRDDDLTTFSVGVSEYEIYGASWMLCISPIADEADFAGHDVPQRAVTVGTLRANLYAGDYGVRCVWRVNGYTCLLETADGRADDAETITRSLMELFAEPDEEAGGEELEKKMKQIMKNGEGN